MNGPQMNHWRKAAGYSLRELCALLAKTGHEISPSTLSRWENSTEPVPGWASDIFLGLTAITLPLEELQRLLDHARRQGIPFAALLSQAIRDYLRTSTAARPINDRQHLPAEFAI